MSVIDHAATGRPTVYAGQKNPENLEKRALVLAYLPVFRKEDGLVLEISRVRRALHPLESIEKNRAFAFRVLGIEYECGASA